MSRAHPNLERTIALTEAKLRRLYDEQRVRDRNAAMVAEFDGGKSIAGIAKDRGLTYALVQGVLNRAGRTVGGRMAIRNRLRSIRPGADQSVSA